MSIEIQIGRPVTRPLRLFTCTTIEMLPASVVRNFFCGLAAIMRSVYSVMHHHGRGCAQTSCCPPAARTCQGARHQILHIVSQDLYYPGMLSGSATQCILGSMCLTAKLSRSYQGTFKSCTSTAVYLMSSSGAVTLFRVSSDSLHCNSCMQEPIRNLPVYVYMAHHQFTARLKAD